MSSDKVTKRIIKEAKTFDKITDVLTGVIMIVGLPFTLPNEKINYGNDKNLTNKDEIKSDSTKSQDTAKNIKLDVAFPKNRAV